MEKPTNEPTEFQKQLGRFPLYVRLGWGLLLLFGMVGNCARPGNIAPIYIFIFVGLMWSCTRAMTEAIDAYHTLRMANAHDAKQKEAEKPDNKKEPPPPPPPAPA
jgi:hypothetical protein